MSELQSPPTLPDPIATVLGDPVDEPSVARMWRVVDARRTSAAVRTRAMVGWAAAGAIATLVVILGFQAAVGHWAGRSDRPVSVAGPLLLRDGSPIAAVEAPPGGAPALVELADGSRILVEAEARVEPLASSERELVVKLVRGRATFDVEPGGPRRWVVEAGAASVEVVGTRFVVTRDSDAVRVEVERGVVLVRGTSVPDGVVRLEAGGSVEVRPAEVSARVGEALPPVGSAPRAQPTTESAPRAAWRDAASSGKYADAYDSLGPRGLEREAASAESADDLMTLSDVARLSGHPREAIRPLERILDRHASSPRASLAALTLGRIEMDLGRPARAAHSLRKALVLGVPAGLEEDSYARLIEAEVGAGDHAAAVATADEYARRFPAGRRSADIARWLGR